MKKAPNTLPTDVAALQEMVLKLREQNQALNAKNQRLTEMFRLAQQKRFGKSSDSFPGQGELFNEAEEIVEQADKPEADDSETITYTRRKKRTEKIAVHIFISLDRKITSIEIK